MFVFCDRELYVPIVIPPISINFQWCRARGPSRPVQKSELFSKASVCEIPKQEDVVTRLWRTKRRTNVQWCPSPIKALNTVHPSTKMGGLTSGYPVYLWSKPVEVEFIKSKFETNNNLHLFTAFSEIWPTFCFVPSAIGVGHQDLGSRRAGPIFQRLWRRDQAMGVARVVFERQNVEMLGPTFFLLWGEVRKLNIHHKNWSSEIFYFIGGSFSMAFQICELDFFDVLGNVKQLKVLLALLNIYHVLCNFLRCSPNFFISWSYFCFCCMTNPWKSMVYPGKWSRKRWLVNLFSLCQWVIRMVICGDLSVRSRHPMHLLTGGSVRRDQSPGTPFSRANPWDEATWIDKTDSMAAM